jgi:hypothetical protein
VHLINWARWNETLVSGFLRRRLKVLSIKENLRINHLISSSEEAESLDSRKRI